MTTRSADASPQVTARTAAIFYLLTIVTGALSLSFDSGREIVTLAATACYVAVTLLFYRLFRPVHPRLSLLAALIGLAGCAVGALMAFRLNVLRVNSLVFFGFYCLLIGWLVYRSTFLPRIVGVLMAIGGLGWLTFISPSLAGRLAPYNMIPGILGETVLTLWLLVAGVNVQRWREQAVASGMGARTTA
jgi:hypothetical protein